MAARWPEIGQAAEQNASVALIPSPGCTQGARPRGAAGTGRPAFPGEEEWKLPPGTTGEATGRSLIHSTNERPLPSSVPGLGWTQGTGRSNP